MINSGGRLENVSPSYARLTRELLPDPDRRCPCGNKLSQYNRSDTCHTCTARERERQKESAQCTTHT